MSIYICPACDSTNATRVGSIPSAYHFCSHTFKEPVNKGDLIECRDCGLKYRNPCLSEKELLALYQSLPSSIWSGNSPTTEDRSDFQQILLLIEQEASPADVCDIGCYSGDLLNLISERYCNQTDHKVNLFGVEPSRQAAEKARSRGVTILGETAFDLLNVSQKFDLILCVDVFEHVTDPDELLRVCESALHDNGRLVIVTGASDSEFALKWGALWNYVTMPEHIVFVSKKYIAEYADRRSTSLRLEDYKPIFRKQPRKNFAYRLFARNVLVALLIWISKVTLAHAILPITLRRIASRGITNISSRADHALIVMRKSK